MKIITYNVNGLRAAVSKGLPEWLEQEQADVVCIQETKLQPDQYPEEALSTLGYKHYLYSPQSISFGRDFRSSVTYSWNFSNHTILNAWRSSPLVPEG